MSLLVVGSVGIDTVVTPTERREQVLGGSAVYFSYAASFFTPVSMVSVVGEDFPDAHRRLLKDQGIDLAGLEVAKGKTFRWTGRYHEDLNTRDTLEVDLNVFGTFDPKVPEKDKQAEFLFLANGAPAVQRKVLQQMKRRPKFIAADTMDLWINTARPELEKLIGEIDALVINDSEVRLMTRHRELLRAGRELLELGVPTVIIKKGEHGALVVNKHGHFVVPAMPLEAVTDPTGAGDSFAGGIMGYLASTGDISAQGLRRAVAYGSVVASFTVEDFSLEMLCRIKRADIDKRFKALLAIANIEAPAVKARAKNAPAKKPMKKKKRKKK